MSVDLMGSIYRDISVRTFCNKFCISFRRHEGEEAGGGGALISVFIVGIVHQS